MPAAVNVSLLVALSYERSIIGPPTSLPSSSTTSTVLPKEAVLRRSRMRASFANRSAAASCEAAYRGMVTVTREGRRSLYTPAVSREAYLAAQSRTFFEKLCGGSVSAFAAALCQSGISEADLKELRELLERGSN